MKLMITIEADVSKTIAATIKRSGFTVDAAGCIMVPNAPLITSRKVKITYGPDDTKPCENHSN
jgi:hypothetical protein